MNDLHHTARRDEPTTVRASIIASRGRLIARRALAAIALVAAIVAVATIVVPLTARDAVASPTTNTDSLDLASATAPSLPDPPSVSPAPNELALETSATSDGSNDRAPDPTTTTAAPATTAATSTTEPPAWAGAARFVAQRPERVVDTRESGDVPPAETPHVFSPGDVAAVAVSVSVVDAGRAGSVVFDGRVGAVEALRLPAPGATTTNLVIVPVDGTEVTVRSSAGGHLVVDVVGTFVPVDGPTAAGRFVPIPTTRIAELDTATDGRELAIARAAATDTVSELADAEAVLAVVTADVGGEGGSVRLGSETGVYDQMLMWAPASSDDRIRRGLVLLTAGDDLLAGMRYEGGAELTVDVVGIFTGDDAAFDYTGLYVSSGPRTIFDGPVGPDTPVTIDGLDPATSSAIITLGPRVGVPGRLGSTVTGTVDGTITVTAPDDVEVVVTLLGEFV